MAGVAFPRLCCIPACAQTAAPECGEADAPLCSHHWAQVSDATKARAVQTRRRLEWLTRRWHDRAFFDAVERSGRYLKFASALAQAVDAAHLASQRVRIEAAVAALLALVNDGKATASPSRVRRAQ
jgi:hypothetical protein